MEQCSVDGCTETRAFPECDWCLDHKCSYGRLKTCFNRNGEFRRCEEHRAKIHARQSKKYDMITPDSKRNLIRRISELETENRTIKEVGKRLLAQIEKQS